MTLPTESKERKKYPMYSGLMAYFPDALAEVANTSWQGNEQHNPGEPLHWAREKSSDHEDCVMRHLLEHGTVDTDGIRHTAKLAWRALAMLQLELEEAYQEKCRCSLPTVGQLLKEAKLGAYQVGVDDGEKGGDTYEVGADELATIRSAMKNGYTPTEAEKQLLVRGIPPSDEPGNWLHDLLIQGWESLHEERARKKSEARERPGLDPAKCYSKTFSDTYDSPLTYNVVQEADDKRITLYVAGPMTGYEEYNFPAFDAAAKVLRDVGYNVINPADLDREAGVEIDKPITEEIRKSFISRDIKAILSLRPGFDGIALLPGWMESKGAVAEQAVAKWWGLEIARYEVWMTQGEPNG